ncbi:glycosyltransferase family 2 protein [Candidatus Methanoperedens nitratireducens]|uniref:glycosyltransferase family 2 protein n=1 Tax=Candidatus Methanoperedens nitratireducens TaxID=1392998 RepID=UPI001C539F5B|nr:glycosyltransferase family 2 protein [Candidatus Methanoperedens nitroreducens]
MKETKTKLEGGLRTKGLSHKKSWPDRPLISIITVVRNGQKYLEETIKSVINQTYDNVEYIIIDGGSTDGTLDIIKKYEEYIDYWVSEQDRGISDAMNKGVRHSTGKLILHLHSDDIFCKNESLCLLYNELKSSDKKWVTGFYKYINSRTVEIKIDKFRKYTYFDMVLRNIIRHQTTLLPRNIFEEVQFDEKYKYAMDYMFFLNAWRILGDPHFVNEHITCFRLDGNNLSSNFYASISDEMRARIDFRLINGEFYKIPFDYIIYTLRLLKIYFYHSRKYSDK